MLVTQQALDAIMCKVARLRMTTKWMVVATETGVVRCESKTYRPVAREGEVVVWTGDR